MEMMKHIVSLSLLLHCFFSSGVCLTCNQGEIWLHEFAKSVGGREVQCSDAETHCLRMESTGYQFGFPVNVTATMCATPEVCENTSCRQLSAQILNQANDDYGDDASDDSDDASDDSDDYGSDSSYEEDIVFFRLKACDVVCCQENNCNFQSISDIRRASHPTTSPPDVAQSTTDISLETTTTFDRPATQGQHESEGSTQFISKLNALNRKITTKPHATQGASTLRLTTQLLALALLLTAFVQFLFS